MKEMGTTIQASSRRRGGVYVAVLGSAMMTSVIGLSALMLVRAERQAVAGAGDMLEAKFLAQSATEMAQLYIRMYEDDWRDTFRLGIWAADFALGTGTFTVEATDPVDGDLKNSLADPLLLTGTGAVGSARYKLQATLVPVNEAVGALGVSAHAGANLVFTGFPLIGTIVNSNQKIGANENSTASLSTITAAVEVSGNAAGLLYIPLPQSGVPLRSMPAANAFDYYVTNGVAINYASLPSGGGGRTMEEIVLSPNSNPYGAKDSEGIYILNCQGARLRIRDTRIVGTLVVLNHSGFTVEDSVLWQPAISNYPSLLVQGGLDLIIDNATLKEGGSVNYNPPGTPYAGVSDNDMLDSYPSRIHGLVYATGQILTDNNVTVQGVLVAGGNLRVQGTLSLTYDATFYDDPPPGFGAPTTTMELSPGSWRRLVD